MEAEELFSRTQEQAIASWISHLNQLRINALIAKLYDQDENFEAALKTLCGLKESINNEVINKNRGGIKGMHGFIAERAQVGIENARKLIIGAKPEYVLTNDNGPVDYCRNNTLIQQKFVQKDFGLSAIKDFAAKYPEYKDKITYQIPKDFYEVISLSAEEAKKLTKNDVITYAQWKRIHEMLKECGIDLKKIEPSVLEYKDVQQGAIADTIAREKTNIEETDRALREKAVEAAKPTLKEGTQVTAVSAAMEGSVVFCLAVMNKRKSGKGISEFTADDWNELGIETGIGVAKGGIRGATVYTLSNFSATPACVASALVTATFGIASQAKALRANKISEEDFLINSETLCLDVSIGAITSLLGQTLIPIPILGAMVGNVAGMFMYEISKNQGLAHEQDCIAKYRQELAALNQQLDDRYRQLCLLLEKKMSAFQSLTVLAFDLDINVAFPASVTLARFNGADEEKILKTKQEVDTYFLS